MGPVSTGAKVISAQVQGETRRISWFGRPAEPCDQIAIAPVVTIGQARLVSMASTPPTPISWYLRRVLLPSGARTPTEALQASGHTVRRRPVQVKPG